METTRPPGFPGNPPARMPRAPTPARSPPPRPLRCGEIAFRPTHDVGPHKQCISGLNHAAYGLPVNASRPGSPQAHASLGSGWRPTLAGWDWIPTGFRTRFQRSHHGILSPLTGLSRHTRWCTVPALSQDRRCPGHRDGQRSVRVTVDLIGQNLSKTTYEDVIRRTSRGGQRVTLAAAGGRTRTSQETTKLRQAEVEIARGQPVAEVCRKLGTSEQNVLPLAQGIRRVTGQSP